jgi:cysteine-rich repeat protein
MNQIFKKFFNLIFFIIIIFFISNFVYAESEEKLISYWNFNNNVIDQVGVNDGNLSGAIYVQGFKGNALLFDGVDDFVNCGSDKSLDNLNEFTYSAWIYPKGFGEHNYGRIIDKGVKLFYLQNSGYKGLFKSIVAIVKHRYDFRSESNVINLDEWQYVVMTFKNGTTSIFHNGKSVFYGMENQLGLKTYSDSVHDFFIGNSWSKSRTFDGIIDEVKVYNYSLSSSDILKRYNSDRGCQDDCNLVGYGCSDGFVQVCGNFDSDLCLDLKNIACGNKSENVFCESCVKFDQGFCSNNLDVVLIMDRSGSMKDEIPNKLQQSKESANDLISKLRFRDRSALVSFSSSVKLNKPLSTDHEETKKEIDNLEALGATNIGDGIGLAIKEHLIKNVESNSTMVSVLLTDGKPRGGNRGKDYVLCKAKQAADKGISIFSIGIGEDSDEDLMKQVSNLTGGKYYYAPSGNDTKEIFNTIAYEMCNHSLCGNNNLDAGEECDDGNRKFGDGCNMKCLIEVCGNNNLDAGEECDDGNILDGDGCNSLCKIKLEDLCERIDLEVAMIIDKSPSMKDESPTKLDQAKEAATNFVLKLRQTDKSTLISFDRTALVEKELSLDHNLTIEKIYSIFVGSSTNIGDGIKLANKELIHNSNSNKNVSKISILLSDGKPNTPFRSQTGLSPKDYAFSKAIEARDNNVKIYTIGVGCSSIDKNLLKDISNISGGKFYSAPSEEELNNIFNEIAWDLCNVQKCNDECSLGEKRFLNNSIEICGNYDSDSCMEWGNYSSCKIHSNFSCYDNDVYWFDSCGVMEEKKQECENGCSEGECIATSKINYKATFYGGHGSNCGWKTWKNLDTKGGAYKWSIRYYNHGWRYLKGSGTKSSGTTSVSVYSCIHHGGYGTLNMNYYLKDSISNDSFACYDNDVYWFDSRGVREEKKQECENGCFEGECVLKIKSCVKDTRNYKKSFYGGYGSNCGTKTWSGLDTKRGSYTWKIKYYDHGYKYLSGSGMKAEGLTSVSVYACIHQGGVGTLTMNYYPDGIISHDSFACVENTMIKNVPRYDVYWFNSCGWKEDIKENCVWGSHTTCSNGICSSSKVLCTEANKRGLISDDIYQADLEYANKYANEETLRGYHSWAKPLVRIIKENDDLAESFFPLVIEWAKYSAYEMDVLNKDSEIGKTLVEIGFPLCEELGELMIRNEDLSYEFEDSVVEEKTIKYFGDFDLDELSTEEAKKQLQEKLTNLLDELKEIYLKEN